MKRLIAVCLLLCIIFCLAACSNQPDQQATGNTIVNDPNETTTNSGEAFTPEQQAMVAISIPAAYDTVYADNGDVIFRHLSQTPQLYISEPEVAQKITTNLLNRLESDAAEVASLKQTAALAYANSTQWTPYLFQVTYNPTRIDHGVLSFLGTHVQYTGGSHPIHAFRGASYDMLTGDTLTLANILAENASVDNICELVLAELKSKKDELGLYSFYEDSVRQRFQTDTSTDQQFYFTQTGLCFFFDPLELAPYSAGVIQAEIPYSDLTNILYPGYFPDEHDRVNGTVLAHRSEDIDTTQFTQTAELTLNRGGEMIFLHTDSAVSNIRIEQGEMDPLGTSFIPTYTAFAAASLTPGDAILVEVYLPDVYSNLRLTYESGYETVTKYIFQSGKDGSIQLLDS